MHFSFSAVNENDDKNEIQFSAEKRKRKRKSPVPISQNLVTAQLRTYIFGPTQMTFFWNENEKYTKMKIHFRPKMEKAENNQIARFRRRKRISVWL